MAYREADVEGVFSPTYSVRCSLFGHAISFPDKYSRWAMGKGVMECLFFRVPFSVASPPPHPRDITAFSFGLNYKSPLSEVFAGFFPLSIPFHNIGAERGTAGSAGIESTAETGQRAILERTKAEFVLAHYYSTARDWGLFAYLLSSHPRLRSLVRLRTASESNCGGSTLPR
jgi:hypothetical protein